MEKVVKIGMGKMGMGKMGQGHAAAQQRAHVRIIPAPRPVPFPIGPPSRRGMGPAVLGARCGLAPGSSQRQHPVPPRAQGVTSPAFC